VQDGPKPLTPTQGIWRAYFQGYGGVRSLRKSKYFWASVVFTAMSFGRWKAANWWEEPIAVIPNMLGFSLGGYAVLLAFGNESFRETMAGESPRGVSPFIVMNTTFVHFIVVQGFSLLLAVLCKNTYVSVTEYGFSPDSWVTFLAATLSVARWFFWCLGYALFLYSICLALAATMGVFRVARLYDYMITDQRRRKPPPNPPDPPHEFL
jgi:hypothetical protein